MGKLTNIYNEILSLEANEVFEMVLAEVDAEARDGLVSTKAEDTDRIRDHQAMARAVKEIRSRVQILKATSGPKTEPGL